MCNVSFMKSLAVLLAVTCFGTMTVAAQSNAQPRVTQAVDDTQLVTLTGHVIPLANANTDRGPVADSLNIDHMHLVLQRSAQQEQALDQFMVQQSDRTSPNFHQWLTAEQFGEQYGVAQQDIDAITGWLQSHGFTVNKVYANRMMIDFSGSAGQLREAFHTPIHQIVLNGEQHIANVSNPRIPSALAPVIKGIASLNDIKPKAMHEPISQYTFAGCADTTFLTMPGTDCYAITPQDSQTIYNVNPLYSAGISGQGQTIYLVEDTDSYGSPGGDIPAYTGDWNSYVTIFGLTHYGGSLSIAHPGGCTDPGTNADDSEADLDVEVASAIAPAASLQLISCPSGTFTFGGQIALQNLINEASPTVGVVSVSYGICEAFNGTGGNAAFYNTYQQAAAEGFSVFVAAGDEGPSSCSSLLSPGSEYDVATLGVTGWGETPYNVTVGGTDFEDTYDVKERGASFSTYWNTTAPTAAPYGSALSYIPEIPWNDACAMTLISDVLTGSFTPYGASPAACNNSSYDTSSTYLSTGAGSGGASNCATGAGSTDQSSDADTVPGCQGYPKPSWQSGASLPGGVAVYGVPNDGVRDIPDVAMFAANGIWGHYEVVCWSDDTLGTTDSAGSEPCTGAPSTWSGFGGTSVATPTMAAVQALINQKTGETWGNPNPVYYQIGQSQYGIAGGDFQGSSCNSSSGNPGSCAFNDITQGDIDLACEDNGTLTESQCYKPTGTHGVDSTDTVTAATVINGGSGYTSAPTCAIAGPTNNQPYLSPTGTTLWAGGTQATCKAAVNSGTNTAVWTVVIATPPNSDAWTSGVGGVTVGGTTYTFVSSLSGAPANSVLYVYSGSSSTQETDTAKNLEAAINDNSSECTTAPCFNVTAANASATATESTSTVTLTAKTAGYAGNFTVSWANGFLLGPDFIRIANTTAGQGPNYVSGITITAAGSGYQPDTPITLSGGGSGAIAVANTSVSTAPSSYQPSYGAAPGYDLATGLGSPNANALVNSSAWLKPQTITFTAPASPVTYGVSPITLSATASSGLAVTFSLDPTSTPGAGSLSGNTLTVTGVGTIVIDANQAGNSAYAAAPQVQQTIVVNPAQVSVPNVVGDTQAAATTAVTGAGLVVGTVTTASSSTVPLGDVISESPAAGTLVNGGSAVNLVVSSGPAQVSSANIVGVQGCGAYNSSSATCAITAVSGQFLVAFTHTVNSTATTVTPSGCVTWTQAGTTDANGDSWFSGPETTSGSCNVTITAGSHDVAGALVWNIANTANTIGTFALHTLYPSSSPFNGSSITTATTSGQLVLAAIDCSVSGAACTGPSGWTSDFSGEYAGFLYGAMGHYIQASPGAITPSWSNAGTLPNLLLNGTISVVVVPSGVSVPNVVGDTQAAATTAVTGAGLVVGTVTTASSSTVPLGDVISESPAAGTLVNGGSAVNLVVSSGPAQVSSANIVGVQGCGAYNSSSATCAITAVSGQFLVAFTHTVNSTATTVTPSGCVTWTQAGTTDANGDSWFSGPETTSGSCNVTITAGSHDVAGALVWNIANTANTIGTFALHTLYPSSSPFNGSSITTATTSGQLVLAAIDCSVSGAACTGPSGWTSDFSGEYAGFLYGAMGHYIQASPGAITPSWSNAGTLPNLLLNGTISVVVVPSGVSVPNVVGDTQAAATTAVTGAGLVVGTVTTASSSTVPLGDVISESPAAGTLVNGGSAVNLVVSSGPAQVSSANIVGVQGCGAYNSSSATCAITAVSGQFLVAFTHTVNSTATTVTPSGCVTWTQAGTTDANGDSWFSGPETTSGSCNVTITAGSHDVAGALVWNIANTANTIGTFALHTLYPSSSPFNGSSITTATTSGQLVLAAIDCSVSGAACTGPSGWTSDFSGEYAGFLYGAMGHYIQASPGAITPSWSNAGTLPSLLLNGTISVLP